MALAPCFLCLNLLILKQCVLLAWVAKLVLAQEPIEALCSLRRLLLLVFLSLSLFSFILSLLAAVALALTVQRLFRLCGVFWFCYSGAIASSSANLLLRTHGLQL